MARQDGRRLGAGPAEQVHLPPREPGTGGLCEDTSRGKSEPQWARRKAGGQLEKVVLLPLPPLWSRLCAQPGPVGSQTTATLNSGQQEAPRRALLGLSADHLCLGPCNGPCTLCTKPDAAQRPQPGPRKRPGAPGSPADWQPPLLLFFKTTECPLSSWASEPHPGAAWVSVPPHGPTC